MMITSALFGRRRLLAALTRQAVEHGLYDSPAPTIRPEPVPDARHSATTGPVGPDTAHESRPAPPTPQRASDALGPEIPLDQWTPRPEAPAFTEVDRWREELVPGRLAYLTTQLGSPWDAAEHRFTRKDT